MRQCFPCLAEIMEQGTRLGLERNASATSSHFWKRNARVFRGFSLFRKEGILGRSLERFH